MKRTNGILILLVILSLVLLAGSACGQKQQDSGQEVEGPAAEEQVEDQKVVNLGIIQLVEHPSLDAARQGFLDVLAENGYQEGDNLKVALKNAQADMSIAQSIAQQFAQDAPDLILAIATPAAQAMAQATQEIPILITAVTDPVGAKLAESLERPGRNVTGTSDYFSVKEQILLLKEIVPQAARIGLMYNSGEQNSVVQAEEVKAVAEELSLEVVEATPTNSGEVLQAAQSLIGKVDAIYVPTDNTVVSALEAVIKVSYENDIPMFPGEGDSVRRGGLATVGVDYYKLGRQTGEKALQILQGANPAEIPIDVQSDFSITVNLKAAKEMNVTVPQSVLDRASELIEE
ncbi:MAG: ABC transporter substrate-binding protein [Bacillota bacterium]